MCTIIMLFIFFNGGGVFKEMWYEHHGIHSSLINNVETYGNVYLYDPKTTITKKRLENFTNSSDNFLFTVNDLDIEHHCIQLYDEVKTLDDEFILISHSRGYMFANVFANMYYNNVKAHINIDGGKTREEFKKYLKDTFSLTTKGYYTTFYGGLGLVFGLLFGVAILSNLERSLGISLGLIGGMVVGSIMGRSKDSQAKTSGKML